METGLWKQFDRIVVFDTETTGIEFRRDEIIELGGRRLFRGGRDGLHGPAAPPLPGRTAPPLSPSSPASRKSSLEQEGVEKADACEAFCNLLGGESGRRWRPTTPSSI